MFQKYQRKSIGTKAAQIMLMKLIPVVNFIKILQVGFAPIFLCQKITEPNCNKKKAAKNLLCKKFAR
jgi:hypothetical protein